MFILSFFNIFHFVSVALVQGLTDGISYEVFFKFKITPSPYGLIFLHCVVQGGTILTCACALFLRPSGFFESRRWITAALFLRFAVLLLSSLDLQSSAAAFLQCFLLGSLQSVVEIAIYSHGHSMLPTAPHVSIFLFNSLTSSGQLLSAIAAYAQFVRTSSTPAYSTLPCAVGIVSCLLAVFSIVHIVVEPFTLPLPPTSSPRRIVALAAFGGFLSSMLTAMTVRTLPRMGQSIGFNQTEIGSLVAFFFFAFVLARLVATSLAVKCSSLTLWTCSIVVSFVFVLALTLKLPCATPISIILLGCSLGPLYPAVIGIVTQPNKLSPKHIVAVVLASRIGDSIKLFQFDSLFFPIASVSLLFCLACAIAVHYIRYRSERRKSVFSLNY